MSSQLRTETYYQVLDPVHSLHAFALSPHALNETFSNRVDNSTK